MFTASRLLRDNGVEGRLKELATIEFERLNDLISERKIAGDLDKWLLIKPSVDEKSYRQSKIKFDLTISDGRPKPSHPVERVWLTGYRFKTSGEFTPRYEVLKTGDAIELPIEDASLVDKQFYVHLAFSIAGTRNVVREIRVEPLMSSEPVQVRIVTLGGVDWSTETPKGESGMVLGLNESFVVKKFRVPNYIVKRIEISVKENGNFPPKNDISKIKKFDWDLISDGTYELRALVDHDGRYNSGPYQDYEIKIFGIPISLK